jgi:CRP/FNR family transcriptional regulator
VDLPNLFRLIEEVVFSRVDVRLAQLLARSGSANIRATHQSLANELGSAREVIGRLLNEFQRRNWVRLSRGSIEITNLSALMALSGEISSGTPQRVWKKSHTDAKIAL